MRRGRATISPARSSAKRSEHAKRGQQQQPPRGGQQQQRRRRPLLSQQQQAHRLIKQVRPEKALEQLPGVIDALRLVKDALHEEAHVKLMVDDYGFQDICHAMQVYLEDGMVQLLGLEILAKSRLTLVDNTGTEKVNTGSTLELTA